MKQDNLLTASLLMPLVLVAMWLGVYWETLSHLVMVWSESETFKHCFIIPFISIYLIHQDREKIAALTLRPAYWLVPFFVVGQIIFVFVEQLGINLLMHLAAVASFVLGIVIILGWQFFRAFMFPILYLFFCVPIGEELVPWLQEVTADFSVMMLNVLDIPVYREGLFIYIPNGTFHVAEACAGVRFLVGTFALGALFAYLNYQKYWKRMLFIVVCFVVPIVANGFRAFGIIYIGYKTNMEHAVGVDHLVYGWFFFAFVLLVLFVLGSIGADPLPSQASNDAKTRAHAQQVQGLANSSGILSGILMIPLLANLWLSSASAHQNVKIEQALTNAQLSWAPNKPVWQSPNYADSQQTWSGYVDGVPTFILYVDESTGDELVSSQHRIFDEKRWTQERYYQYGVDNIQRNAVDIVNVAGKRKTLLFWHQMDNYIGASPLQIKFEQLKRRLRGESANGALVIVELLPEQTAKLAAKLGDTAFEPSIKQSVEH